MNKRALPTRRTKRPLAPSIPVVVVTGSALSTLEPSRVTPEQVGQKAYGLASLPAVWTKPFFVISGTIPCDTAVLHKALEMVGLSRHQKVMVRSSAVDETIEQRGSFISASCQPDEIQAKIAQLQQTLQERGQGDAQLHWVIQSFISTVALGHLSNERRLSEALRDWTVEVEPRGQYKEERQRIAIRHWRDAERKDFDPQELSCPYRANYIDRLGDVARWAHERQIRVHFEWVWDGNAIYVVQADPCEVVQNGVKPQSLVQIPKGTIEQSTLTQFRVATARDFKTYRKLTNAKLYEELGYQMPSFFVLDNQEEIQKIIATGCISEDLLKDLQLLTHRPLVIRTDGIRREMLPRSDELRDAKSAADWLQNDFKNAAEKAQFRDKKLCLLAHHFMPAVASAWCQASPSARRVRIESLWGIPEGIYWYAHDVFDVDTLNVSLPLGEQRPSNKLHIRERRRYKGRFVAPNADGAWVVQHTSETADWKRSIQRREWIEEVAWATRRIAEQEQKSVAVMWFIDIPKEVSQHKVLPWFHSEWSAKGALRRAAPREKSASSGEFLIETQLHWEELKNKLELGEKFSRVVVNPSEPEMVRNDEFALSLANFAKKYSLIVELAGGILSHAYYMLTSQGCIVECVDLDDYALEDDRIEFNKLVRDLIPEVIAARGETTDVCKLENEALITALRRKLVEEAFEIMDAPTTKQITEELADLREVMAAIADRLQIQDAEIEAVRTEKARTRGVFRDGLMLSRTSLNASTLEEPVDLLAREKNGSTRVISNPVSLPMPTKGIHADKRTDEKGIMERQFTINLPVHVDTIDDLKTVFTLDTQDNKPHEMLLEVQLERANSDVRLRLKLINTPVQLSLPFDSSRDSL